MDKFLGIPLPVTDGVSDDTSTSANYLIDSTNTFVDAKIGDIVYNSTDGTNAVVTSIQSGLLVLSKDIFTVAEKDYYIYAPNNDIRGNRIVSIDAVLVNKASASITYVYLNSGNGGAYDRASLTTAKSTPTDTNFIQKLITSYQEDSLSLNGTQARLDVPLNSFIDNINGERLFLKTLTVQ